MQRLTRCMVLFGVMGALSAVSGCASGDPTDNEGTPTAIVSNPDVVFVNQGESQPVVVSVVDEDGQALEAEFTLGTVGAGITVAPDPNFLPVTGGNPLRRQARFFVQAVDLAASQFEISALGLTDTIHVTSVPPSLAAAFSNLTPALGDTITITAPLGTFFSPTSAVRFGIQNLVVTDRTADGSSITFIPAPTIHGPLTVTGVKVTSNPDLTFTLNTSETLITDSLVNVAATWSPTQTPALGQAVTLTLPASIKVIPSAVQPTPAVPPAPALPGLTIAGAALAPQTITVSADSGSISFLPAPNSDSVAIIPGVIHTRLPMYPQTLPTTTKITTPVVIALPSTLSSTAPAVNTAVTLTSTDGNFTFVDPVGVTVGTAAGFVTSQTASTITFFPPPGSTGVVSVAPVDVAGFGLTLPSTAAPMTTGSTVPVMAGTDAPGTAPALSVPAAAGQGTSTFDDAVFTGADITGDGGVGAQYYRITLGAPATLTISISSGDGAPDLDGVICNDVACSVPNFALASVAHNESAAVPLAAGTHILAVVNFDGAPTDWVNVTITR